MTNRDLFDAFLARWPRPGVLFKLAFPAAYRHARRAGLSFAEIDHFCTVGVFDCLPNADRDRGREFDSFAAFYMRSAVQKELRARRPCGHPWLLEMEPDHRRPAGTDEYEMRAVVARVLFPDDARVITRFFNLDGRGGATEDEIAAEMGVTRSRVSQRRGRALSRLRKHMEGKAT